MTKPLYPLRRTIRGETRSSGAQGAGGSPLSGSAGCESRKLTQNVNRVPFRGLALAFQWLGHAEQLGPEAGALVKGAGPRIAGKDRQRQQLAVARTGPGLRVREQRTADPLAIMVLCDRQIGNMADAGAGEEIALDLKLQEAGAVAAEVFRHEEVTARRALAQGMFDILVDRGEHVALAPAFRQSERGEARHQRQDELHVVGGGGANGDARFACIRFPLTRQACPEHRRTALRACLPLPCGERAGGGGRTAPRLHPNSLSGIAKMLSGPACMAARCMRVRGRMRSK